MTTRKCFELCGRFGGSAGSRLLHRAAFFRFYRRCSHPRLKRPGRLKGIRRRWTSNG